MRRCGCLVRSRDCGALVGQSSISVGSEALRFNHLWSLFYSPSALPGGFGVPLVAWTPGTAAA